MYTQFPANERERLNEALKIIQSQKTTSEDYQKAVVSALGVLNNAHAYDGQKLEWARETISAYTEIGKTLVARLGEQLVGEKELRKALIESIRRQRYTVSGTDTFEGYENVDEDTTGKDLVQFISSALEDYSELLQVMKGREISDGEGLEKALHERDKLLLQAEEFDRKL